MNTDEKILKILEQHGKILEALQSGQKRLEQRTDENEHTQAKILSILKVVAAEGFVETTVNTAKKELTEKIEKVETEVKTEIKEVKEAIIALGDKLGKTQREQNIRLTKLEHKHSHKN